MNILLVHPQNYLHRHSTGIYGRSLRYAPLTMPTLKALVPAELGARVRIVDEMVEDLDFATEADLVGITAITGTAPRAYEIADRFRATGTPVVLGGVHPTLQTEESLAHADAVVRGYAERTWPQLLRDFTGGRLQRVYEDTEPFDPKLIVSPDRSGIHRRDYIGWGTVEMGRGCSNHCDFCISHRFHRKYIARDIDAVMAEVKSLRSKTIFFLDPNLISDRQHAKEFFTEFARLGRWWVGCATLDVADDPDLLTVLARSGCRGLLMGFESIRQETLAAVGKTKNLGKSYAEVVDQLHEHGILVQACFVFGFDSDDVSVFEEAADYIVSARFDLPQISIYTPFPGTPVFDRLDRDGRILTRNWSLYNGQHVVFRPLRMTARELEQGTDLARKRAYSWSALSRRLLEKPLWVKPLIALSYLGFRHYQYRIAKVGAQFAAEVPA
ncbi:MAG TPA: radical SAM protein [Verrucomicrobiae bacterium]|nr:radical SAM protein [Verrucomicrobiae bacterium]